MTSATKLPAWLETLAKSWDGCMHDAPGEMIDIGASIRTAASQAPTLTTAPVGYVLVPETPTAEMIAAYRKGGRSVFAMPGWRALLEAIPAHPAEGVPAPGAALDLESVGMPANPYSVAREPGDHVAWAKGAGAVFAAVEAALAATPAAPAAVVAVPCVECQSCGCAFDADSYAAGYTDGKGHCLNCPGIKPATPAAGVPAAAPDARDGLYYLQDARWESMIGNCPSFWRPDGNGYTTNLDEAARFTFAEAMAKHHCRETDLPWLCSEVDKLRRATIDCQYMPRSWDEQRAAIAAQAKGEQA